jgi:hypothetical protein
MNFIAPSNRLIDESGGSMVFSVPLNNINEIQTLFKLIDLDEEGDVGERAMLEKEANPHV